MGKYSLSSTQLESSVKKTKEPHVIWRGIGCLMMVVIPAISIVLATLTVNLVIDVQTEMQRRFIPYQLLGNPRMPNIAYKLSGLETILEPITKIENFYAISIASIMYMILISGVISVIYAAAYRVANPNRYGPLDEPPSRIKAKKHSR